MPAAFTTCRCKMGYFWRLLRVFCLPAVQLVCRDAVRMLVLCSAQASLRVQRKLSIVVSDMLAVTWVLSGAVAQPVSSITGARWLALAGPRQKQMFGRGTTDSSFLALLFMDAQYILPGPGGDGGSGGRLSFDRDADIKIVHSRWALSRTANNNNNDFLVG